MKINILTFQANYKTLECKQELYSFNIKLHQVELFKLPSFKRLLLFLCMLHKFKAPCINYASFRKKILAMGIYDKYRIE